MNIDDQAGIGCCRSGFEKFLRRSKSVHLKPERIQQPLYGPTEAHIVLDNTDDALAGERVLHDLPPNIANQEPLRYCPFGQILKSGLPPGRRPTQFEPCKSSYRSAQSAGAAALSHSTARPNSAGDCTPILCIT